MKFKNVINLIIGDLKTYEKDKKLSMVKNILCCPGFKYTFWMRITKYLFERKYLLPLFPISYLILQHYKYKFGLQIPFRCDIGEGFNISHFGGIVIHTKAIIGKSCYISQGVTIGISNLKVPTIGDSVYIGSGAKIIGGVTVGNNVSIGANCVVTHDIPDNVVVAGIPGKIIKHLD